MTRNITSARNIRNIPDGYSYCVSCKKKKHNHDFHWYVSPDDKVRTRVNGSCRPCRSKLGKETNIIRKSVIPFVPRPSYGTLCEACERPVYERQGDIPENVDGTYAFSFDHDHDTNDFRGWICKPCNTGFGLLGDTYENVKIRLEYLERAKYHQNDSQKKFLNERATLNQFYGDD
jgi:hypothetical protein